MIEAIGKFILSIFQIYKRAVALSIKLLSSKETPEKRKSKRKSMEEDPPQTYSTGWNYSTTEYQIREPALSDGVTTTTTTNISEDTIEKEFSQERAVLRGGIDYRWAIEGLRAQGIQGITEPQGIQGITEPRFYGGVVIVNREEGSNLEFDRGVVIGRVGNRKESNSGINFVKNENLKPFDRYRLLRERLGDKNDL